MTNLNQFLQPVDSPITNRKIVSGYEFDSVNERGIITGSKVRSLTADLITSGTVDASVITVSNISANNINSGTLNAGSVPVTNISPNNLNAGTLTSEVQVGTTSGSAGITLDGPNVRIVMNDGTANRLLIEP
jgi:hypothetical protein